MSSESEVSQTPTKSYKWSQAGINTFGCVPGDSTLTPHLLRMPSSGPICGVLMGIIYSAGSSWAPVPERTQLSSGRKKKASACPRKPAGKQLSERKS